MTLDQLKIAMKKVSESLNNANKYKDVLNLKKEVADLINQFNEINKMSTSSEEKASLLKIHEEMTTLKKLYQTKIKSLKDSAESLANSNTNGIKDSSSTISMKNPLDPTGQSKIKFHIGTAKELAKKMANKPAQFLFSSDGTSDLYDQFIKAQEEERKKTPKV